MTPYVRALLVGASTLAILVGCDDKPKAQEATEAAAVYSSVDECKAEHSEAECSTAFDGAQAEQETTAPHMTLGQCVDTYGANACLPRNSGEYYVPAMTGFTVGVLAGALSTYHPVYVDIHGSAYYHGSYIGTYHSPGCFGCTHTTNVIHVSPRAPQTFTTTITRAPIPPAARTAQPTPPSYNATRTERGGFGTKASTTTASPDQKTQQSPAPAPVQRTLQPPTPSQAAAPRPTPAPSVASPSISRPSYSPPSSSSSTSRGGFGSSPSSSSSSSNS